MDPIEAKNLPVMKSYNHKSQFFYSLIVHSLIAVTCSLLCSYSYWFPSLYTIKHLLFMSLPNYCSGFFNPKCLFIVVNFIVVFLIGESRLSGKQSSPATEMYNEYVERSRRSLRRPLSTFQEKKEERIVPAILNHTNEMDNANRIEDGKEVDESKEDKHDDHEGDFKECDENDEEEKEEPKEEEIEEKEEAKEQDKKKEEEEEEEEEVGIPAEELNKRVEDFIARVNKQRWLEERFIVCSRA